MAETADERTYIEFLPSTDPPGLEVVDEIQRRRYRIYTRNQISPTPSDPAQFHYPVKNAVDVTAAHLTIPRAVGVYVRDESRSILATAFDRDTVSLAEGEYTLELDTQIKTYVNVSASLEITAGTEETQIEFGEESTFSIGARSRHKRPAATITTTENPHDMMQAIEAFGSALKTADPERSYPTLRGHPPAVELGDSLDIPEDSNRPETGIRLELPPDRSVLFASTPLAFYLGAEIVPSIEPRLTTDTGFEYAFDTEDFEDDIARVLKQIFVLDCVTRTEGLYPLALHERTQIEPRLDCDIDTLYNKLLSEQVATYLSLPYDHLEAHIPEWKLTVHAEPTAENIELLPFIATQLAVVRTPGQFTLEELTPRVDVTQSVTSSSIRHTEGNDQTDSREFIRPDESDSLEQAWVGDRVPVGASKLTTEAFENRLDREPADDDIEITVVMNNSRMTEERALVANAYGNRADLPFDVTFRHDLTVGQLRETLRSSTDYLHYIGHTEAEGVECDDGLLDIRSLDDTGVDLFFFNSCNSYRQGSALIEAGALGGVVTLSDVVNQEAVRIGETTARLLNAGFPFRAALTIARDESVLGEQYIVVGTGDITVGQPASITPYLVIVSKNADEYSLKLRTYPTDDAGLGSVFKPYIAAQETHFLSSGEKTIGSVTETELEEFLALETVPVRIDGDLYWSDSLDIDEVFE